MDKQPKPFKVSREGMAKLNGDAPIDDLHRVSLTNDPGWVGYVRPDGTGLALFQPSHLEMMELRLLIKAETEPRPDTLPSPEGNYMWGV